MYILLIIFTVLSLAVKAVFRQKIMEHYQMFDRIELLYTIMMCFWGTAVTLNDQLGGNGLNVFIYMSLIAAAAGLLKPWQSICAGPWSPADTSATGRATALSRSV